VNRSTARDDDRPARRAGPICGIDEAGRGPLAGPVAAAAVIFADRADRAAPGAGFPAAMLNDSKKLSPAAREAARAVIMERAAWGLGWASAREIDEINILQASLLAMRRAFDDLARRFPGVDLGDVEVVVDGLQTPPGLPAPARAMVRADALVPEVMAASILAKTARDHEMERLARLYPGYGYERHKGYPTEAHREAIARLGPSPIQRMTFRVRPAGKPR